MAAPVATASFETKWATAHPEFALALRFVDPAQREARSALACIGFEIAHCAYRIGESHVAAAKLHWWADEIAALQAASARHPLTTVLAAHAPRDPAAWSAWRDAIAAAFVQREPAPASTLDALVNAYAGFERPLATVEQAWFGDLDVDASAELAASSRAFRELVALEEGLSVDRLALPLDLLARHVLARGDLATASPARDAALREGFGSLAARLAVPPRGRVSPFALVAAVADARRAMRAVRADDPLARARADATRLDARTVWATWRAMRRQRALTRAGA